MDKIKSVIAKALVTWVAIGSALLSLSITGFLQIPDAWLTLFSQDIADIIQIALNAVVLAYQAIRGIFVAEEIKVVTDEKAAVKALASYDTKGFIRNPFRLKLAA